MSTVAELTELDRLSGTKLGGLTLDRCVDRNAASVWYEAAEDAGMKHLVYVYLDAGHRDQDRVRIHGFRTTFSEQIELAGRVVSVYCIVGEHRTMMPRAVKKFVTNDQTRPRHIGNYQIDEVLGSGYKGVTYKARQQGGTDIRTPYALKLTIGEEYQAQSYLPEVDRMSDLATRDREHFPQIHACGEWSCTIQGNEQSFVYFVEDFICGQTLDKFVREKRDRLTPTFLEGFAREMLAALGVMEDCHLMHDDLHSGNILIVETLAGSRPFIIDFGSCKPKGQTRKSRDDIRNLASHVAYIANVGSGAGAKTRYEEGILTACEALLAKMSDDDPMRRPESAKVLLREFDDYFPRGSYKQELTRPFDFGNAEEVIDNKLLHRLAAKTFPWRDKLQASGNLVLIGPRGCGKTTVFRSMSFTCLADAGEIEDALQRPYVGLYISCNKEFRQRFSALDPGVLQNREEDLRHYFNLLVLREFTAALRACLAEDKIGQNDIQRFGEFLERHAGFFVTTSSDADAGLKEVEGTIIRAIETVRMNIWNNRDTSGSTTQAFVAELAGLAGEEVSAFHGKVLYLLVDDYTERKVPRDAQRALNHILFVPNGIYKSKISSEVFGVVMDQTFGTFLDQDRDYKELNLGTLYYADLPSRDQKEFLREIVDTRLELCGYSGRTANVIGESRYGEGTLARTLKAEADARDEIKRANAEATPVRVLEQQVEAELQRQGKRTYYHGWDTICNLCTGDVSNVLELLDRMYDECGVKKQTMSRVDPCHQDAVIQAYSLQYIGKIKGIPEHGERLFRIVNAFGNMSGRLLTEYPRMDRGPNRSDPYQLIRIELDEGFVESARGPVAALSEAATDEIGECMLLWMLLQRYCIVIDAEKSRSRRNTLASKVILRRLFCPAFRTTLSNSESFTLKKHKWESFCTDPHGYVERHVRDVVAAARRRRGEGDLQRRLTDSEGAIE